LKSYDKILFKNNFDIEEFVVTILRDETIEGIIEGVNSGNDHVNTHFDHVNIENDHVNPQNDRVNEIFDRVNLENDRVKNELMQVYSFIEENPLVKIASIEQLTQKSDKTVRRYLKILKDNGLIEYIGSDKTGGYRVVGTNNLTPL
jgi:predicted transcriptional regulator